MNTSCIYCGLRSYRFFSFLLQEQRVDCVFCAERNLRSRTDWIFSACQLQLKCFGVGFWFGHLEPDNCCSLRPHRLKQCAVQSRAPGLPMRLSHLVSTDGLFNIALYNYTMDSIVFMFNFTSCVTLLKLEKVLCWMEPGRRQGSQPPQATIDR